MFFSSRRFFQITNEQIRGFLPNSTMIELFCSFFGRIRGQQKVLLKLTDLQLPGGFLEASWWVFLEASKFILLLSLQEAPRKPSGSPKGGFGFNILQSLPNNPFQWCYGQQGVSNRHARTPALRRASSFLQIRRGNFQNCIFRPTWSTTCHFKFKQLRALCSTKLHL